MEISIREVLSYWKHYIKISAKNTAKSNFQSKPVIIKLVLGLAFMFILKGWEVVMNQLVQDIILVASPFIIWLIVSFVYNLLKIPVELNKMVKNSHQAYEIVQKINNLQIEAKNLESDSIKSWQDKAIGLINSFSEDYSSHYHLVFNGSIQDTEVTSLYLNKKTLENTLQMNSSGRIQRPNLNLQNIDDNNIEYQAFGVLEAIKQRFKPYIIPIKKGK